ncbi:hypothetical protein V9T40_014841 [Parthenolecanium corni]|uniref:Uncharacterized protein n=1 Tax=Parthenolecanium corni TaxID=536013 RepID=A0AAN9XXA2_9HEMI
MLLKLFDSEFGYHSIAGAKPYKHETRRRSGFHFARRDATRRPGCTDDECWPCAASRRSADRVSPSHTTHTSAVAANTHIMYAQYIAGRGFRLRLLQDLRVNSRTRTRTRTTATQPPPPSPFPSLVYSPATSTTAPALVWLSARLET